MYITPKHWNFASTDFVATHVNSKAELSRSVYMCNPKIGRDDKSYVNAKKKIRFPLITFAKVVLKIECRPVSCEMNTIGDAANP